MTYIKPEKTPNQSSLVREILEQGCKAEQRNDWQVVTQQLQQLPICKTDDRTKRFVLLPEDWQTSFDLALAMLSQADFQHQWTVAKIFPLFGNKIISPLSALVKDEELEVETRWFICQILGNFPEQSVVLTLVQLLQSTTDSELIAIAGKTLIAIGDRAIDSLVELLSQPEHSLLAAKSLSYIRTVATIDPLLKVTAHEDAEIRAIAINALGSFHDRRILPVLITALEDRASKVRKEAAIALGFRPDLCREFDLVKHLQPLLQDLNLEVCHEAAIALGRMQQKTANLVLFKVLQADTTPISLKTDLIKALSWSKLSSGIAYLAEVLNNAGELISQEIITVLGRTKSVELKPLAARVLISSWQQQQPLSAQVRQIMATALGELRDPSAQIVLEQLAIDGDRKVQLHALSALKKLSNDS